jgi:epoxide hydrolase 4
MIPAGAMAFETDIAGDGARLALFLHGFPETKYSWRNQLPLFAERGFTAWAPNLRGYGRSTAPTSWRDYHLDHLLGDVAALIDEARARGHGPVTLVAHDWGGIIAWFFAMRRVRPLERLVVMNLPHPRRIVESLRTRAQLRRFSYLFFFQLPWISEWMMTRADGAAVARAILETARDPSRFPPEVLDHYRLHALGAGTMRAMLSYYRALFWDASLRREARAAPRVDVPTLLLWAEEDDYLGKELTHHTDALVERLTVRYFPGVSHWIQQEAPDLVNAAIGEWLDAPS